MCLTSAKRPAMHGAKEIILWFLIVRRFSSFDVKVRGHFPASLSSEDLTGGYMLQFGKENYVISAQEYAKFRFMATIAEVGSQRWYRMCFGVDEKVIILPCTLFTRQTRHRNEEGPLLTRITSPEILAVKHAVKNSSKEKKSPPNPLSGLKEQAPCPFSLALWVASNIAMCRALPRPALASGFTMPPQNASISRSSPLVYTSNSPRRNSMCATFVCMLLDRRRCSQMLRSSSKTVGHLSSPSKPLCKPPRIVLLNFNLPPLLPAAALSPATRRPSARDWHAPIYVTEQLRGLMPLNRAGPCSDFLLSHWPAF